MIKLKEILGQLIRLGLIETATYLRLRTLPLIGAKIFNVSDLGADAIYTLSGLRQVGKTTLIKFLIKDLLNLVEDPKTILYLSCDPIENRGELQKM